MGRTGRNRGASAISDRSGTRFPMSEMVTEPGTNYLVHKSESDGQWSAVSHPLNNLGRYLKGKNGDPFPVRNARPRPATETTSAVPRYAGSAPLNSEFYLYTNPIRVFHLVLNTLSGAATLVAIGEVVGQGMSSADLQGTATFSASPTTDWAPTDWLAGDWI